MDRDKQNINYQTKNLSNIELCKGIIFWSNNLLVCDKGEKIAQIPGGILQQVFLCLEDKEIISISGDVW